MKLFFLNEIPYKPVSHDLELKKKVLAIGTLIHVSQVSHIILQPGTIVSEHLHTDYFEVFYCITTNAVFLMKENRFSINKGHLLIVKPGESHSINVIDETKLLYLHKRG